jgi:hypothetical protein
MQPNSAFCLITHRPNKPEFLSFLNSFQHYKIYIIIDDNEQTYETLINTYKNCTFIQLNNDFVRTHGYTNLSDITLEKDVTGWDKAVFYFTINKLYKEFQHIWICEDDVYFYSEQTLRLIDEKYLVEDILCNCSFEQSNSNEWLWFKINQPFVNSLLYCGMMCIVRFSPSFFECIEDFVFKNKKMFFLEAFFPMIAKNYPGLLILTRTPYEFVTVTYRDNFYQFNKEQLFHPMKNIKEHIQLRVNN